MAHFAELDANNVVKRVVVVSNSEITDGNGNEIENTGILYCQRLYGDDTRWKQTSYNSNMRKRHAGIGMIYNEELNAFIIPKPYTSWTLNSDTAEWDPPVPRPESETEKYAWNEENQSWDQLQDQ
jgi:hypothetical protein